MYAIKAISFLHGSLKLCVHIVSEDAAHNHVAVTRVLDEFLKAKQQVTYGMTVYLSQISTHGEHVV